MAKKATAKAATKKLGPWNNVLVEVEDGIAWVTLNRPEKRNAMNPPLNNDMVEVLDAVELEHSAGVLVLRVTEPARERPFRVPLVWVVAPHGIVACRFVMLGLPRQAWERFGIWLVIGAVLGALYGYRHSRLRNAR